MHGIRVMNAALAADMLGFADDAGYNSGRRANIVHELQDSPA
jgi:hypothetical protein